MESVFTRPLFINTAGYDVIPELSIIHLAKPFNFLCGDASTVKVLTNDKIEAKIIEAGRDIILHLDLYNSRGCVVLGEWYMDQLVPQDVPHIRVEQNDNGELIIQLDVYIIENAIFISNENKDILLTEDREPITYN